MASDEHINLRVGPRTTVVLMFEGTVTRREIDRLISHLELMSEDYPTPDEERAAEHERNGIQWSKPSAS